jgi:hypothetical protein
MSTPYWEANGRYGYWAVDEYRLGERSRATYGSIGPFPSRKLAESVASQLNTAYARGRRSAQVEGAK